LLPVRVSFPDITHHATAIAAAVGHEDHYRQ
jgi:hypothetical protein